jgi:hypothetical protein
MNNLVHSKSIKRKKTKEKPNISHCKKTNCQSLDIYYYNLQFKIKIKRLKLKFYILILKTCVRHSQLLVDEYSQIIVK